MNRRILSEYGHKMINGFLKCWPDNDSELRVYCEDGCLESAGRIRAFDLFQCQPELKSFLERNKSNPLASGGNPYTYKYDACKFAHKSYAIIDALETAETRRVYWLDADVQFLQTLDGDKLYNLVRGFYSAYLGRKGFHTETGFLAFDTSHEAHPEFVRIFREYYDKDLIFNLSEWHDCAAYDATAARIPGSCRNLTPSAAGPDHVFNQYWLPVMSHHKGPQRKRLWADGKERHQ